jgi:ArsR family metal-binding transcriptional regulator
MSYLQSIMLIKSLPCLAEPGKIIIIGKPDRSLVDVIPYLATLPGIIAYNPDTCTLTFQRQPGFLTISPDKVYITQVRDPEEGLTLLNSLKEAVNATWDHRYHLKPAAKKKQAPRHLDIFALLPQTNCKQCGEATCLAFAVSIILQKRSLEECLPLHTDPAFNERKAALAALI